MGKIQEILSTAVTLKRKFPKMIVGFDFIGEEEGGRLNEEVAKELFEAKKLHNLTYIFHAGETNWVGKSGSSNLLHSLLLGSKRVGHGLAIVKHPEIKRLIKNHQIPLEISPISNQVLGYVSDLRNHPGSALIREGFPMVISNDDPTMWGAEGLSYDYYTTFMAFAGGSKMDLRLLKKLSLDSIKYGDNSQKCFNLFDDKWEKFLVEMEIFSSSS